MSRGRRGSWSKYQTDEGYEYYYDEDTQNSQWERPDGYTSDEEKSTPPVVIDYTTTEVNSVTLQDILLEPHTEEIIVSNHYTSFTSDSSTYHDYTQSQPQSYGYPENASASIGIEETEDSLNFEYNPEGNLFEELSRLTLFQPISSIEKSSLRNGTWCRISCRKLEVLQECLENYGTEAEWKTIFCHQNHIIMRYLLKFMHPSVHPILQDGAARCLAYAHLPYSALWTDYLHYVSHTASVSNPSPLQHYRVMFIAIERIKVLIDLPAEALPSVPYAGFDFRDIHDYNMVNLEDYRHLTSHEATSNHDPFSMKGTTDVSTTISTWLLLLFELFRAPSRLVGDDFRKRRVSLLGMKMGMASQATETEGTSRNQTTENFLDMVTELLTLSSRMKEDAYLLCIKVIAAINWQLPTKDLVGSTEIGEICAKLQFGEVQSSTVNVSQGLLHLLNDIGYPNHKASDTLPTLQLCYHLITTPGYEGFFYLNDLKILVEVIIRELSNIPWDVESWDSTKFEESSHALVEDRGELIVFDGLNGPIEGTTSDLMPINELTRQMYLKLTTALMTRTCWPTIDNYYKKAELDAVLQWWIDNSMVTCSTTVELVSDVLDKKFGVI